MWKWIIKMYLERSKLRGGCRMKNAGVIYIDGGWCRWSVLNQVY